MAKHDRESTIIIPLFYEILPFVRYDILIQLKNLAIYLIHVNINTVIFVI